MLLIVQMDKLFSLSLLVLLVVAFYGGEFARLTSISRRFSF